MTKTSFGWDDARIQTRNYALKQRDAIEIALDSASNVYIDAIKRIAPKDTGKYKNSIKVVLKGKLFRVIGSDIVVTAISSGISYNLGWLLEFGTKAHDIEIQIASVLYGNGTFFGKKVHHPGTSPRPHFEPAKADLQKAFPNLYRVETLKLWRK